MKFTDLKIKIFADGADVKEMEKASLAYKSYINEKERNY